uniref:Dilute domain-containing protein n=1 Tax=Timema cristinae TaxID=61476 RepID=A0A7R9H2V3_TIMCR|nr:unnamed protein product [Timema cristinae]
MTIQERLLSLAKLTSYGNTNILDTLQPIMQAAHLLQVNKHTENDAKRVCDTCDKLSMTQVRSPIHVCGESNGSNLTVIIEVRHPVHGCGVSNTLNFMVVFFDAVRCRSSSFDAGLQ